uniref:Uncharacterized protein n=1 Tax=Arundo donax TaxID=35708 RepID=A0A0A9FT17_ARUDO
MWRKTNYRRLNDTSAARLKIWKPWHLRKKMLTNAIITVIQGAWREGS